MDRKQKTIIAVVTLALVLLVVAGSYAFFVANINNDNKQEAELKTANMSLRFADHNGGISASLDFGKSITKEFLIENTGPADATANMYWKDLTNTYLEQSLTYKLEYKTGLDSTTYIDIPVSSLNVPRSETQTCEPLAEGLTIPANTTYYYRLTITLEHLDEVDQTQDFNAKLSTWFDLEEKPEKINTIQVVGNSSYGEKLWQHKADITKVIFENTMNAPSNYTYSYDISDEANSSVMTYLVKDTADSTKYVAHIQANGKIYANPDSSYLFAQFINLISIEGLEYLDTSNVNNMYEMFHNCSSLKSLNLNHFNTKSVNNMRSMFSHCRSLEAIYLNHFNTTKVTDMAGMFYLCDKLTNLDVSSFNISKVTNMYGMFQDCQSLTSLNLGNFDTSNVVFIDRLFYGCRSLTELDVSSFNTKNAVDMTNMFSDCRSLETLDLSNFDTGNVTDMRSMFDGCSNLSTLDLSSFDTNKVINMQGMFKGCSSLTDLDLSNFNTSNVTSMRSMFQNCSSLTNLNLQNWNISTVTSKDYMFTSVPSSIKITVSNTTMRDWVINASGNPKLTTTNIIVQA